jgi:hypothetical protein
VERWTVLSLSSRVLILAQKGSSVQKAFTEVVHITTGVGIAMAYATRKDRAGDGIAKRAGWP